MWVLLQFDTGYLTKLYVISDKGFRFFLFEYFIWCVVVVQSCVPLNYDSSRVPYVVTKMLLLLYLRFSQLRVGILFMIAVTSSSTAFLSD